MTAHILDIHKDEDGWDYGVCSCGWSTPPVPGVDIVTDAYGDHRADSVVNAIVQDDYDRVIQYLVERGVLEPVTLAVGNHTLAVYQRKDTT